MTSQGHLLILDGRTIRRVNANTGIIQTIFGHSSDGLALASLPNNENWLLEANKLQVS